MGMTETLRLVIDGVPSGAKRALGEVRSEATKTEKTLSGINAGLNKAANIAAVGVAAGVGVMAKSLKTYEDYSSQVRSIQRALGADAEGASRLAGQWKRYGVDAVALPLTGQPRGALGIGAERALDAAHLRAVVLVGLQALGHDPDSGSHSDGGDVGRLVEAGVDAAQGLFCLGRLGADLTERALRPRRDSVDDQPQRLGHAHGVTLRRPSARAA